MPQASVDQDALLESVITGASRSIDEHCRRPDGFYATTRTRYFAPCDGYRLWLGYDLLSVTTLKTDEDGDRTFEHTWAAATDYYLAPANAVADGEPYDAIEVDRANGRYAFPVGVQRGVEIVGSWGYCATGSHPALIADACRLAAARHLKRKDSPLGVAGSPETGFVRVTLDPDIKAMLWPFVRTAGVG